MKISKGIIILSALFFGYTSALACTDITLKAKDGTVLVARTMEFGPNLDSAIVSSPRAKIFKTKAPDGKPGLSWSSKYGYIFADYFHSGHPVDGINEKGLSFGYLYLPGYTQYPTVPKGEDSKALSYIDFADWVLGNFSSVAQVKKTLSHVDVFAKPSSFSNLKKVVFPLHAIITDAKGHSIVIEFVKGKVHVYNDKLGILTNSPTFDWQITNLKNYVNLSPYAPAPIKINGQTYSVTGQGSGMLGLPGDSTPPSRFVRMAVITSTVIPAKDAIAALVLAQHIIGNVDIPRGMVRGEKGKKSALETTQWTVFKDLTHHILYFKSYDNSTLQSVAISKVDLSPNAKQLRIPISRSQIMVNAM
jgi:choloylglycine hydrolase